MNNYLVITGGSRGIGLAAIRLFGAHGYRVINLSRRQPPAEGITHLSVDMTDDGWEDSIAPTLKQQLADAERIVLIHNAGMLLKDSVRDIDAAAFHDVLQLNVVAASQLNALLLPLMPAGSSILYVNSTLGEKAVANTCSYVASKHAQLGLMKSTCQDLFESGIHTAAVCPGFTDTEMLRNHVGNDSDILQHFATQNAYGRLVAPEEIADTLWFCSQSPVVNGAVIHANLGQLEN